MATNYLDTGDTGRAVSSESDGALFAGIFGAEKYVLENGSQLKAEVQSNNIVKISDGDAVMYGRHVRIQANDSALVTINNGHSGTNRIDLIVFRYTKDSTGKETVDLVVIQGEDSIWTPTAPTAVNGNILTGAMKSDFPLYSVELNGINIVKVNPLFNVIGNISKLKEELTELNGKLEEKGYSISQGGSLAIRNQRITKKNNRVSIMAGLYTTGLGNANTRYNGGSIPAEIAPPGSGVFPAIVTKDNWTLIGIGCVIIETNGAITYQINSSFQKDTYIWLDVSYDL
ncbi:Uncharacterised protein [[Ruminococcus] torques]|nr:Uncharacterised protein [[Ruminococcus] torques]